MNTMQILSDFNIPANDISKVAVYADIDWPLIYIVMVLATTLMCTVLIAYHIIHLVRRLFLFHDIIDALIKSAGVYMLVLIIYLTMTVVNIDAVNYVEEFMGYVKVKMPLDLFMFGNLILSCHYSRSLHRRSSCCMWCQDRTLVLVMRNRNRRIQDLYWTLTLG